jgi:hypothetical protein
MVAGDSVVWSFQEKRKSRRKWKIEFFFTFFLCSQCSTEVDRKITKETHPFPFLSLLFNFIILFFSYCCINLSFMCSISFHIISTIPY